MRSLWWWGWWNGMSDWSVNENVQVHLEMREWRGDANGREKEKCYGVRKSLQRICIKNTPTPRLLSLQIFANIFLRRMCSSGVAWSGVRMFFLGIVLSAIVDWIEARICEQVTHLSRIQTDAIKPWSISSCFTFPRSFWSMSYYLLVMP